MKRIILILLLCGTLLLSACQSTPADSGSSKDTQQSTSETARQGEEPDDEDPTGEAEEPSQEENTGGNSVFGSLMGNLPLDASTEDMIDAFEKDYIRASLAAGAPVNHDSLDYDIDEEGMARAELGSLILMVDPPSTYYRVWWVGYPESETWMKHEAQLVLMAGDATLSADEAGELIDDIFQRAWDSRNSMPSAVDDYTENGLEYSMSTNDRGLVSFYIWFPQ